MAQGRVPAGLGRGRRAFALALAVSVLAHAALLGLLRLPGDGKAQEPPLMLTLTARFRQVPQSARAPAPAVPSAEPAPPAPVPAPPVAPALVPGERRVVAAPAAAASAPERLDDQIFLAPQQWTTPPLPDATPDATQLSGVRLVGRRLLVQLWIDDEGAVRKAVVVPYELSAQAAALLEQMFMGLRFSPATIAGRAIGARVDTRLCIDDAGRVDTHSEGCWRFDGNTGPCGICTACVVQGSRGRDAFLAGRPAAARLSCPACKPPGARASAEPP